MAASSTAAWPLVTVASTGTRPPFLTMTVSPTPTVWAGTSTCSPSRTTMAVVGARATSSASAERVLARVAFSRAAPSANRNVTAAASQKFRMKMAPMAATETSRSMPITFTRSALMAFLTTGVPATMAAASMNQSPTVGLNWPTISATTISVPETAGIAHLRMV